jgi:anti-anti-sigma factor
MVAPHPGQEAREHETDGVVRVRGELDLSTAELLRRRIGRAQQASDDTRVVIDLGEVTFVDSAGLSELIRPAVAGCVVTLVRPSEAVRRLIRLAGVEQLFITDGGAPSSSGPGELAS